MSEEKSHDIPETVAPLARVQKNSHCPSFEAYKTMYDASVADPSTFWSEQARKELVSKYVSSRVAARACSRSRRA